MIYLITLHFQNQTWYDIQLRYLQKYTSPDKYKVILGKYQILNKIENLPSNYIPVNLNRVNNNHKDCVYELYRFAQTIMKDDDIFVFLDGDTLPVCSNWIEKLETYLQTNDIVSVYRYEDAIGRQDSYTGKAPHLCFTATTRKIWEKYNLSWDLGGYECPGYYMQDIIKTNGLKVKELIRSNKYNAHNVMFGVYDDMIYHHGNGSTSGANVNTPRRCFEGQDLVNRKSICGDWDNDCKDIIDINEKLFKVIFDAIKNDQNCNIIKRYFIGKQ